MTDEESHFGELEKQFTDKSPEAAAVEADLKIKEEFPALIGQLVTEQLGRPIQAFNSDRGGLETIGITLPTMPDNSEHLVVFQTGEMVVMQPGDNADLRRYKESYSPNTDPYVLGSSDRAGVMSFFMQSGPDKRVVLSNGSESDEPQITEKWKSALRVAAELRAQQQRTRIKTMKGFMEDTRNMLYGKDEPPPASPPPADQAPPPQQ